YDMNGGPYRAPQPADRRVINRSGGAAPSGSQSSTSAAPRQADESFAISDEPFRASSRPQEPYQPPAEKKSKKGIIWTLIILIIGLSAFAGWLVWSNAKSNVTGIDS